jgi:hypothetical protein
MSDDHVDVGFRVFDPTALGPMRLIEPVFNLAAMRLVLERAGFDHRLDQGTILGFVGMVGAVRTTDGMATVSLGDVGNTPMLDVVGAVFIVRVGHFTSLVRVRRSSLAVSAASCSPKT